MSLKIRRGLAASRTSITPAEGEFIYTTDTKIVYIGDGTTVGGNVLSGGGANTSGYLQVSNATILFNNRLTVANSRNYLQVANSKTYLQVANATTLFNNRLTVANSRNYLQVANSKAYLQVANATTLFNNRLTVANSRNYLQVANADAKFATKAYAAANSYVNAYFANNDTYIETKAPWSALTGTNTALRSLISDRLQVANAASLYATKGYASSNTYVNATFLKITGPQTTSQTVNTNIEFAANVHIEGKLTVTGGITSYFANNVSTSDNMIYLNANSTISNPDLGFAGNYNDGTYAHAGFFRDASDNGTFKVFHKYTVEPDANVFIDTSHGSFQLAPFAALNIRTSNNLIVEGNAVIGKFSANGSLGSSGQFLRTNGTTVHWSSLPAQTQYLQVANATTLFNNRLTVANSKTYLQVANATATYQTKAVERAALANTNSRIGLLDTNLTGTNTALRALIDTKANNVGAADQILYRNSSNVLTSSSGLRYDGTNFKVNGNLESVYSNGDEGGEIFLNKPVTSTSITTGVFIDVYQNKLRFWEAGGSNRGAYIDLTAAGTGVGSNLLAGGGSSSNGFSGILVGANVVVADSTTDRLTFVAGSGMTIAADPTTDTITFSSTGGSTTQYLQVANAVTLYTTKVNPTTSGILAHTGRVTVSTNLYVSGNTVLGDPAVTTDRTVINGVLVANGNLSVAGNTTIGAAGKTVNSTGWFGVTGRATVSTNLLVAGNTSIKGLSANGTLGTPNYVLKTNGTTTFWGAPKTVTVNTATSTANLSWNSNNVDQYQLTAMAAGVTVSADAGTPANGQKIVFRFKDNGTARSISLTTGTSKSFRSIGTTLPTTTVISKTLYVGAIYNSADDRWDVVATAQET